MAMAIAVNYAYYVRFDFRFYSLCALKIIHILGIENNIYFITILPKSFCRKVFINIIKNISI